LDKKLDKDLWYITLEVKQTTVYRVDISVVEREFWFLQNITPPLRHEIQSKSKKGNCA